MKILDKISYTHLVIFAVILGLAPFHPQPHLVEKIKMLMNGALSKPIDIFDLFFHSLPIILLVLKLIRDQQAK